MKGWIYIITNKSMPNLVKVGYSTEDPEIKANALYSAAVPYPYVVEYDALVNEPSEIEQKTHEILEDYLENNEWFRCDVIKAVVAIREAAGDAIINESIKFPFDTVEPFDSVQEAVTAIKQAESVKNNIVKFPSQEIDYVRFQYEAGRFVLQDGMATDTKTGLTWLRFAYGQCWGEYWEGNGVIGNAKDMKWRDALLVPAEFNRRGYAGYKDWRVPNIDELRSLLIPEDWEGWDGWGALMEEDEDAIEVDEDVFPKSPYSCWSSTPNTKRVGAWRVSFRSWGRSDTSMKSDLHSVRLVRG